MADLGSAAGAAKVGMQQRQEEEEGVEEDSGLEAGAEEG